MISPEIFIVALMATFVADQGVTSAVDFSRADPPATCVGSYDGTFEITVPVPF